MREIFCPNCGTKVATIGIGRRRTSLTVINVCDALRTYKSIVLASEKLDCSRGLIYKLLKTNGMAWDKKKRKVIKKWVAH